MASALQEVAASVRTSSMADYSSLGTTPGTNSWASSLRQWAVGGAGTSVQTVPGPPPEDEGGGGVGGLFHEWPDSIAATAGMAGLVVAVLLLLTGLVLLGAGFRGGYTARVSRVAAILKRSRY